MMYIDSLNCEEIYEPEHIYRFSGPCKITCKKYSVDVPAPALYRIRQGEPIQAVLPDMPSGDREFLISGISPEGWIDVFGVE